jgi:predicted DNA-binding protein (MmcQ/YjbR family)
MIDNKFRELINKLEGVEEQPHFNKTSFKINNKIFVTLNLPEKRACVKLDVIDQSSFCSYKKEVMYPVPNAYGKQGWTLLSLELIPDEMLEDALNTSYEYVKASSKKGKKKP